MTATPARSVAAMGAHTLVSRLVIYASAFVASVLVARGLGPAGNGRYAVAMTIGTIAAVVASLGFEQAQAKAWSRGEHSRAVLWGAAIPVAAIAGTACALLALGVWGLGSGGSFSGLGLAGAVVIVAALVPVRVLVSLARGLLVVGGQIERSNRALVAGDIARTLGIVALALAGALSVEAVLGTFWLTMLVALTLHAAALGRPQRPPPALVSGQLVAGATLSPYFVFLFLNLRLDVLLLAALAGAHAVGVYAVAVMFAELVLFVTDAINAGVRERQWGPADADSLAVTAAAARMSLLISLLAVPVLMVAAPVAIAVLFGDAFAGATDALWALLPAAVAMGWWRALSPGLVRFGRPLAANAVALAALAVNVGLCVALIGPLGIAGAALASLGSYAVGALLATIVLCGGPLDARELVPRRGDARRLGAFAGDVLRAANPRRHGA
jgi:O-antigen/teichoic acid export membrane protein